MVCASAWRLLPRQLFALCRKNGLIRLHAWKANVLQLLQAVFFVLLIWGIDRSIKNSNERLEALRDSPHPEPKEVDQIPDCDEDIFIRKDRECFTLLYSPKSDPFVAQIMNGVMEKNDPPIPDERVRGFANMAEVDNFLLENQDTTLAAVHFSGSLDTGLDFVIQTNTSVKYFKGNFRHPSQYIQLPLQMAVERELVRYATRDDGIDWKVSFTQFAHPASEADSIMSTIAPTFLLASAMFNFVVMLGHVVHEKESGVRQALRNMGLLDSAFWASWLVSEINTAIFHTGLVVAAGTLLQLPIFLKNDTTLMLALIFLADLALMSIGFLLSVFLKQSDSAVPAGFSVFIVAWVMQMTIAVNFPYSSEFNSESRIAFNLFPWTLLSKAFKDLSEASVPHHDGISWSNSQSYCRVDPPSPAVERELDFWLKRCVTPIYDILWYLAGQSIFYMTAAIYLDNVLPDSHGVKRAPWYFLAPGYWWPSSRKNVASLNWAMDKPLEESFGLSIDEDVKQERDRMRKRCKQIIDQLKESSCQQRTGNDDQRELSEPSATASTSETRIGQLPLELFSLRKVYSKGGIRPNRFVAVEGTWLGVQEGECFCLLGPNGAGKTTTINCLTGIVPPTGGDALVHGESIRTTGGLDAIRSMMGVCPQFDILWNNLTGREHLRIFADIKGLPRKGIIAEVESLLEQVKLTEAGDVVAGAYSGGMRRRLSVAIALLGDPKIVYLDEPTTGMDPISRRHVWDLIDKAKKGRVIVLTTHAMEEADMLGDRIGIMARGRLRCLGNGLRLKARFGSGYRMSVSVEDGKRANQVRSEVKAVFKKEMGVDVFDDSQIYLHFLIPKSKEKQLGDFIHNLKKRREKLGILDIQLSLTPLEEVFLNVAREAELEYARANGKFETLAIAEENTSVQVPLGAESIQTPSGASYFLRWGQDESGALKLMDYCLATSQGRRASWIRPMF